MSLEYLTLADVKIKRRLLFTIMRTEIEGKCTCGEKYHEVRSFLVRRGTTFKVSKSICPSCKDISCVLHGLSWEKGVSWDSLNPGEDSVNYHASIIPYPIHQANII